MARILLVEDNRELATLVASVAHSRGHTAFSAHTGRQALEALGQMHFDAAVVDLLLPDMTGNEVLTELKNRSIPGIAVSGVYKGERFVRQSIDQHGAKAFFEKPFDIQALLESLERFSNQKPAAPPEAPAAETELDDIEITEALEENPEPAMALPFGDRSGVWVQSRPSAPAKNPLEPVQSGDLRTSPVPRLLTAYFLARHSGELKLRRSAVLKVILFQEGVPIYAASNVSRERFGPFCVEKGTLTADQVATLQTKVREEQASTAEIALRLGFLTEIQRKRLVELQAREIIWSTFPWEEGTFEFAPKALVRKNLLKLTLPPAQLIFEGMLRVQPLPWLRRKMAPSRRLMPSADPPYPLYELNLSNAQASLLVQADGSKTVEDLRALTDLSEREVLATLLALELLGILVERHYSGTNHRITFGL